MWDISKLTLEQWSYIAQIITAAALGIALAEYFYRRKQDRNTAVADQISFFTSKILPKYDEYVAAVRKIKGNGYVFKLVKLDTPSLKFVRDNYFDTSKEQAELFSPNSNVYSIQTTLLNLLEELAIRIVHFNTEDHEALNSIKTPFVMAVEHNGTMLLWHKQISTGKNSYSYTLNLYMKWKDSVDRRPEAERMKEFLESVNKT